MTRGQLAIITNEAVYTSNEFNGDMYPSCYGKIAVRELKKVKDMADYQFIVAKFNKEHHHYNDLEKVFYKMDKSTLDFTKGYFDNWFSDYVYIKNLTSEDQTIITEKGEKIIPAGCIARLCFGTLERIFKGE